MTFRSDDDDLWDRCWTTESAFTEAEVLAAVAAGQWRPTAWVPASGSTLNLYVANAEALASTTNNSASSTIPGLAQASGQQQHPQVSATASSAVPVTDGVPDSSAREEAASWQSNIWEQAPAHDSAAGRWLGQEEGGH